MDQAAGLAWIFHRISSREREECCQCGAKRPSVGAAVSTYCNLALGRFVPQWRCYPRSQQEFGEKSGLVPTLAHNQTKMGRYILVLILVIRSTSLRQWYAKCGLLVCQEGGMDFVEQRLGFLDTLHL